MDLPYERAPSKNPRTSALKIMIATVGFMAVAVGLLMFNPSLVIGLGGVVYAIWNFHTAYVQIRDDLAEGESPATGIVMTVFLVALFILSMVMILDGLGIIHVPRSGQAPFWVTDLSHARDGLRSWILGK